MKILLLDPYLPFSHQIWKNGLINSLDHEIFPLTLPPYHWKWRMHSGALVLAEQLKASHFKPDLIIATEMLDVNLFLAQMRKTIQGHIPIFLYFHENQLTYPVSIRDQDNKRNFDNHYAFINFTSAITSDVLIFNSHFHRNSFLGALPEFLHQFPENDLASQIPILESKSSVIYPGYSVEELDRNQYKGVKSHRPIILWNHRWEYDKNPDQFFRVLIQLSALKLDFDLVVLGQSFGRVPAIFKQAQHLLSSHILHFGYVENRDEYYQWLWKSDIVISTSNQDYFGISVVEAIHAGCLPLLPNRLAFPEHIPEQLKYKYLYESEADLIEKCCQFIGNWPVKGEEDQVTLKRHIKAYQPTILATSYEALIKEHLNKG